MNKWFSDRPRLAERAEAQVYRYASSIGAPRILSRLAAEMAREDVLAGEQPWKAMHLAWSFLDQQADTSGWWLGATHINHQNRGARS